MMKSALGLFTAAALWMGIALAGASAEERLTIGVTLEPPHLDPTAGAAGAIDEIVYANVFEGLTRINENGRVQPGLAERWVIEEDGLRYRFILRKGVTFHDGAAFTSADVKFSLERAMADDSVNAQKQLFDAIDTIETPDEHTVVVNLKRKEGLFLWNLGWGDAVIVDPASADTNKTDPIGTGPYEVSNWTRGDSITLSRREDYWGPSPAIGEVRFKFIADPAAQIAAMLAGDVDVLPNTGAPEALAQFESDPRFEVFTGSTEGETILAFNHRRAPMSDIRFRRAVSHAIDREALIEGAMFGFGTPIGSHFAPHNPAYVDLTGMYPHDADKARALLTEMGGPPDRTLVMKLPPTGYARRGGEQIAAQLKAVGIEVEIIPVEWAQWLSEVFKEPNDYDMTIVSHTEPLDIGIYARDDYYFGYDSAAVSDLMAEIAGTSDPVRRNKLYKRVQNRIAEDAVNGFLFQLAKVGVQKAGLKGMWRNQPIQANDVTGVRWE